jgi:aminocyclitol acetyltransferase
MSPENKKENFLKKVTNLAGSRKIVIWGTDVACLTMCRILISNQINMPFFISDKPTGLVLVRPVKNRDFLDPSEVFVLLSSKSYATKVLEEKNFVFGEDFTYIGTEYQKFDYIYDDVPIGRYSTNTDVFKNCLGSKSRHNCIKSIGRYVSIDARAYMNGDHKADSITTSQRFIRDLSVLDGGSSNLKDYLVPYNKIEIGNDVWIGANTFINASKVKRIGNGAIIGTGAVVIEDVPDYAVIVGVPGKVKKFRFSEKEIEILQRVKWWDWDEETIEKNRDVLTDINLFFEKFGG